jgi:uncharacterized UPF0160 family protein
MIKNIKLVTHSGPFHADDVTAVAIALLAHRNDAYSVEVTRSRNPEIIAAADLVFDVGGVYDPDMGRFDHHQSRPSAPADTWGETPLSSAGMAWKKFAGHVIHNMWPSATVSQIKQVRDTIYDSTIKWIDQMDVGVGPFSANSGLAAATLSGVIGDLNISGPATPAEVDARFMEAVAIVKQVLIGKVLKVAWGVALPDVLRSNHAGMEVVVLDHPVETTMVAELLPDAKLVVHPSDGQWMVLCVPPTREEWTKQRVPFPERMAGRRGFALSEALEDGPAKEDASQDDGSRCFVHGYRFCGGMRSREAALDLAQQVLKG